MNQHKHAIMNEINQQSSTIQCGPTAGQNFATCSAIKIKNIQTIINKKAMLLLSQR